MATPTGAVIRLNRPKESTTPNTAICSSFSKQVLLHDWWLIEADSDSHGKRLGIGGFTSKERQGIRSFSSAPIVMRHDAVTLKTVDGITVLVHGHLNRSRTLENDFSHEVCDFFQIGFPYYWEEFAAISNGKQPVQFSCSHAYKTSNPGDHGTNTIFRNIFDEILQKNYDNAFDCGGALSAEKENPLMTKGVDSTPDEILLNHKKINSEQKTRSRSNVKDVEHSGPLTRSRARLLQTMIGSRSRR